MKQKTMPFSYKTIEDNTGFLLWQISHMWQYEQEKAMKENFNISQLQYVMMASIYWLNIHRTEVTQACLSQHTKIEKMTVSKNLKRLQKKSYIQRKAHSSDLRANAVSLTEQGTELIKQAVTVIEKIDREFFISLEKKITGFNNDLLKLIVYNENTFFKLD
jgi:DNA-binding MarR family transcriptional regulator